jgi:PBP1b-binding outer membrane lipoprotein LpoB
MNKLLLILGVVVLVAGCAKKPAPVMEEVMSGEVIVTGAAIETDALDNSDMMMSGEMMSGEMMSGEMMMSGEAMAN